MSERDHLRPDIHADDEYHTPANAPRAMADRLLFNTRLYFISNFLKNVLTARNAVRRGRYGDDDWINSSQDIFNAVERSGGKIHITGLNRFRNLPEPVVFLSNHMSTLETMILAGIICPLKQVTFAVKDELVRHWAFKDIMLSRNPVVLSRSNPREDFRIMMEEGLDRLQNKISIIIFPQGTRKLEFIPREFNSIGTKLAAKAGVSVVPVAVKTDFWRSGKPISWLGSIDRKKHVHIAFGEPIPVSGQGKEEHQKVIGFIEEHLASWK